MRQLYTTGVQQYAYYGTEVVGMTPSELKQARSNYLALVGSPAKSSSTSLSLAVLGDPLWRQALGPLITYISVVWKATISSTFQKFVDLPRLGGLAGDVITQLPTTWGGVAGPLGAAHQSLKRIGWTFVTPLTIRTQTGELLKLTSSPPALTYYHLQLAWKQSVSRSACKALGFQSTGLIFNQVVQSTFRAGSLGPYRLNLFKSLSHPRGLVAGPPTQPRLRRLGRVRPLRRP